MPKGTLRVLVAGILLICGVRGRAAETVYRWVAAWDAQSGPDNLEQVTTVHDGYFDQIEVAGRKAVKTAGEFLYFRVPDAYLHKVDMDMTMAVDYFDVADGLMRVQYDGLNGRSRNSYKTCRDIKFTGTGTWKRAIIPMPAAYLANGENDGADMRVFFAGTRAPVAKVRIHINGLENDVYESADRMQQARRSLKRKRAMEQARLCLRRRSELVRVTTEFKELVDRETNAVLQPLVEAAREGFDKLARQGSLDAPLADERALDEFIAALRTPAELADNCLQLLEHKLDMLDFIEGCGKDRFDWLFFTRPAIDNVEVILPWTLPASIEVNAPISLQMCRGEYEPGTIGILARKAVRQITVTPSDLHEPGEGTIPAARLDIRIVKRWYQAGRLDETRKGKELVPELLIYDDSLIKADLVHQENVLSFAKDEPPDDADRLLPFDLEALYTKQLWLTIHAPDNVPAGIYRGTIRLGSENLPPLEVPIRVEILPFDLVENPKISSMYHSGDLDSPEGGRVSERDRRRFINMREHGLTNPTVYLVDGVPHQLEVLQELGLNKGPLLTMGGYSVAAYLGDKSPEEVKKKRLKATVDRANALAREFGYDGAYIYAIDEAAGKQLAAEVPVFNLLDSLGGGAWSAVLSDFGRIAVRDLQLPNYSGFPSKQVVDAVHEAGHRIIRYGSPQGCSEDAWQWRYRFGLLLWELNLDGGCTWAYRGPDGSPWDDFDGRQPEYRDFMMTYPGADGPIDTVQWEGFREACDDLRYMATLEKVLAEAGKKGIKPHIIAEVEKWYAHRHERPFEGDNLNAVREHIIRRIIELR